MAYYLQMNGVDDRLQLPSVTFTEVIMDFKVNSKGSFEKYWTLPFSAEFFQIASDSISEQWTAGVSALYLNGVAQTNLTTVMITGTRGIVRAVMGSAKTNLIHVFNNNGIAGSFAHGDIWDIKLYNGAALVVHYDMTLGNVQDQSGNGNHGTLTGGTWVSDATGTTQTGASSVQGVSTITAAATVVGAITGSASLQGVATLAATATVLNASMLGSAALQGISTLTATGNKMQTGGASLTGVATSTVFAQGLTVPGGASLSGVGVLTAPGVSGASIARAISLFGSLPSPIALLGESVADIHLQASWTSTISLLGSKPEPIALEGGLMTKTKQDFTMYAGDTPPLSLTMADSTSLSGATVKWSLRRGNVKGTQVLLKTNSNGLSVSGTVATISLLNADTISLEGQFYHEAEVTDVSGNVSTVMTGTVTITPSGV